MSSLYLTEDLSIYHANEHKQLLLDALSSTDHLELDLSQVSEIDSAGLQLMLAAKREAAARKQTLQFTGHSPAVFDALELCRLSGQLGDPVLIQSQS